jgi:sugar lactone lactonase YvrE
MKLAVSPGGAFGDEGGLYVAVFGDAEPLVENLAGRLPTGILRVDPGSGETRVFLQNKTGTRAGRYEPGIKRAIACAFAADGSAMYVLDFGHIDTTDLAPNPIPRTGVLWRIAR